MKIEDYRVVRGVDGKVLGVTVDGVLISKNDNWQRFCEDVVSRLLASLPVDDESSSAVQLIKEDYCRLRRIGVFISIDTPNHS